MALPGSKPPGQAALEKKKVTWNCTPPQSQLSSTRVLVEATPSEYGCGGMNEEDADDSYMADLLAASQPAESPMTGNQLKASQYHNQEGSFGESSPLPLDTSLDLSANHIAPPSSQTQAAQNSLERNIPIEFANYTRIDMNSSDRSMFGSLVHPARSLGTSNSEDTRERLSHRTGQPLTSDTRRAPEFQQTLTPEARKIAQEASTASGLAKYTLSSQCSLVCGSSPAQLEISMEMGEPMHIHSTGVMQSTIPPHPPSQSNLATPHVSEVSPFLAVDNEEDDIDRANAIDRPLQSTFPKNASLARSDVTRRLALAASESDDSLADSSSDRILSRSNIDFSLNNTPKQRARAHLDTNELSHLSPRTDQLLYSPALNSILNSPGSPTRSYRSPPRSLQPLSSTLDLLDPPHLANKTLTETPACSKSSKLELVSSEVQNQDEENDASVDLRFQGFRRRTRSSNSTQQFQGLQDSNSRIHLNQDQASEAARDHNTPQDDFRGDVETQENGSLSDPATQINEPLPLSRNSLPTRSAASLPRRNMELPHNQLETLSVSPFLPSVYL
ncbi:hypothetical protein CROQUDRAFT_672432 [Cronartium quercuum f. sp. fusiforme G11]|uniref:Uncharacterized protein n=1 Tax=Cronartium quercuum f. sp. fusiforme G11 TaxID=708437 RepID=A0A9P6TA50_9BASI|nr:hypothetical protein CROQUDRAFT_672432 [Cronartium quercuum f. sp. fusiforme G11]